MNVHFILVKPELPENIGACARAIKTMGFSHLRLVNPGDHLNERAKWVAHGSVDILENALLYPNLEQAVKDIDLAIGTTIRKRAFKRNHYTSDEIFELVNKKKDVVHNLGIVFGSEENGLTNDELRCCDLISGIPIAQPFPSLNLAQAVMIYAYCLSPLNIKQEADDSAIADDTQMRMIKHAVSEILQKIGIDSSTNVYVRLMEKIGTFNERDVKLLHFICKKLNEHLTRQLH